MKYRIIVHLKSEGTETITGPVVEINTKQYDDFVAKLTKVTSNPDITFRHTNEDGDTNLIPSRNIKYIQMERS